MEEEGGRKEVRRDEGGGRKEKRKGEGEEKGRKGEREAVLYVLRPPHSHLLFFLS